NLCRGHCLEVEAPMAIPISPDASIEELDLPQRSYNALRRNRMRAVCQVLRLSDQEILRMIGVGPSTLEELDRHLAGLGLRRMPKFEGAALSGWERAQWIGQQLDALSLDIRCKTQRGLFDK